MIRQKSPLSKYASDTPASADEMEAMRRRAWKEQGILTISPSDPCLVDEEPEFIREIAERRYGRSYGGDK